MAKLSDVNKIGMALNSRITEMKAGLEKKYNDSLEVRYTATVEVCGEW